MSYRLYRNKLEKNKDSAENFDKEEEVVRVSEVQDWISDIETEVKRIRDLLTKPAKDINLGDLFVELDNLADELW